MTFPCESFSVYNHSSSTTTGRSRFWRIKISLTALVFALSLKVLFGKRIAPNNSARSLIYFRTELFALSIVNREVINAIIPPGRTLSNVLAKK